MLDLLPSTDLTLSALIDLWHVDCKRRLREYCSERRKHLLLIKLPPELLAMPAERITRKQIGMMLQGLADTPAQQRNFFASLRAALRWALARGLIDTDPTYGLRSSPPKQRDRVLSEAELRTLWHVSARYMIPHTQGGFGNILRLLMLTGQRKDEIAALTWDELVPNPDRIELPASRTKNKRPHTVPLAPLAVAQLPEPRRGYPNVFGVVPGRKFSAWGKLLGYLNRDIGGMPHWTVHDLRRSMVTHCMERGIAQPHVMEAVVNHITGHKGGIAGLYNRAEYAKEKREALERWAEAMKEIAGLP